MQDRVSLVRYFADMRKLVNMCYKLAIEKEELKNKLNYSSHLFSNNEKKRPNQAEYSGSSDESSSISEEAIQQHPPKTVKKANKIVSKTRSGVARPTSLVKSRQPSQIWPCNQCDKQYHHFTSLKRHIATEHPNNHQDVQKPLAD